MSIKIGCHVSFKSDNQLMGSVKEALSYGANTFMFYTGAPQNTIRSQIKDDKTLEAKLLMKENNINISDVVIHAPYIINLASNSDFAVDFLKQEVKRCEALGIKKLVLHPGSYVSLSKSEGINNIINGLNKVLDNESEVTICLETMSGKGTEIGSNIEELKTIINNIKIKDKIGICLDTCHLHDSGYDISNFDLLLDDIDKILGLSYIKCVHINDSKNIINSKKDRHENIGLGYIGFDNIIKIIYNERLKDVPKILETPYVGVDDNDKSRIYPPYKFEIESIKNKVKNNELIKSIREYYK